VDSLVLKQLILVRKMSLLVEKEEIDKLEAEVAKRRKALKERCSHPDEALTVDEYQSNSDWDQFAHYERSYKCGICGKYWTESVK